MRKHRHSSPAAFTLVEILSACAVTLVVAMLSFRLLASVTQIWQRSEIRMDTTREARAALDLISRDLRTALAPQNGSPTFWLQRNATLPGATGQDELYFLTMAENSGSSSLCAVGYRVVWNAESRCYLLMRRFLDSDHVSALLQAGAGQAALATLFASSSGEEEEAARYIWDFRVRPGSGSVAEANYPNHAYGDALPEWVSIEFKALGPSAARRFAGLPITQETWATPESEAYREWILPHQQQFRTRVALPSAHYP